MGRDTSESDNDINSCTAKEEPVESYDEDEDIEVHSFKKYKCNHQGCGKLFNRPWRLAVHQNLHINERPFTCKVAGCSKAYTNSSHLTRHVRCCHSQTSSILSLRCTEPGCDAQFKTKQSLKKHLKRKHSEFPFKCCECSAQFKRNRQLKEHIFTHTGVHPYRCETCSEGFVKMYDLKRHKRGHRTYTCKFNSCKETLTSVSLYRKHLAKYHRPDYICLICNKKFSTSTNLDIHVKEQHYPSTDKWKCEESQCGREFSQERYLNQHMEYVHKKCNEFICPISDCKKVFHWKKSILNHVKLHSMRKTYKKRKKQEERVDKGIPKLCMLSLLSGIELSPNCHKEIIAKGNAVDTDDTMSNISSTTSPLEL